MATGLAPTFRLFILARFLGGLAVGGASIVSPMYVAEVSPAALRGRLCAFYQLSITLGILVSYCINYLLRDVGPWNWRWMFISGALPSVVFVALLLRAPETPRYLCKSGRCDEAFALLSRITGEARAAIEIAEIQASLAEPKASWRHLAEPGLRRALAVGFVLAVLVHFSGINTFIDYAPIIFQSAGWKMDAALFSTFVIGLTNFLFTLVSFWVINRHGRQAALHRRLARHDRRAGPDGLHLRLRPLRRPRGPRPDHGLYRLLCCLHRAGLLDAGTGDFSRTGCGARP